MPVRTGVKATFSAAHRDRGDGALHGHDYEVIAWFVAGGDALGRQRHLEQCLEVLDHKDLGTAWAEEIAAQLLSSLHASGCVEVEVNRPWLGLYARAF